MKQPFVNATINERRKGRETLAQPAQSHPARPTAIASSDAPLHLGRLPVNVIPKLPKKAEGPAADLEKMKMELLAAMRAIEKKPRAVPKSKLIGMANASASEEPARDFNDILAMLLAKK